MTHAEKRVRVAEIYAQHGLTPIPEWEGNALIVFAYHADTGILSTMTDEQYCDRVMSIVSPGDKDGYYKYPHQHRQRLDWMRRASDWGFPAEYYRASAERNRSWAEHYRARAEYDRAWAEHYRARAEYLRVCAERDRARSEYLRVWEKTYAAIMQVIAQHLPYAYAHWDNTTRRLVFDGDPAGGYE